MRKIFFLFLLPVILLNAQVDIPVLKNYANDFTNTLSGPELGNLNSKLWRFDDSTSNQVVFLMISSLQGYSLESFTYETASKNQIGSKKNNNGVLFFVSKDDRKMRIEVGYGLEGVLTDALTSSIQRNEVRPYFKQGDYYAGISAGLNAIISASKGEYRGERKDRDEKVEGFPFIFVLMLIIFLVSLFSKGGKGGRRGGGGGILPWIILGSMTGGKSRGGWGGGGGFGGSGGFGGF
ncbi:MAG: methanol dehydrogenase, partial [Ignavibacteriae bacterium HGW-Ignavibacteriae-3]